MTTQVSEPTARRSDALDELAALFLTERKPANEAAVTLAEPAFRELLIVGNLPVRGGVWLTPYADAIARENGPTALVRFDLEPPTLELLRSQQTALASASALHAANGSGPSPNQPITFKDAVLRAASEVAVWIVRGPARSKPADVLALNFDRITILTSADSAAVVAAYQIVKEIVAAAADDETIQLPRLALAIAGADQRDADDVVQRVNDTASTQLGVHLELAHCLTRMDAGIRCETFASFAEDAAPSMRDLLEWIDEPSGFDVWEQAKKAIALNSPDAGADALDERPPLRLSPVIGDEEDAESTAGAKLIHNEMVEEDIECEEPPVPVIETLATAGGGTEPLCASVESTRDGVRLVPKPVATSQRENKMMDDEPARDDATSLAAFVVGLAPLPVRCPAHDEVELASDDAGRVHVLAREDSLRELRVVETWAKAHRQLIAMACLDRPIDATGEVVCHIFTEEPATLADLHGTGLRLHVLAPVKVGNETAWYAAPLSK